MQGRLDSFFGALPSTSTTTSAKRKVSVVLISTMLPLQQYTVNASERPCDSGAHNFIRKNRFIVILGVFYVYALAAYLLGICILPLNTPACSDKNDLCE